MTDRFPGEVFYNKAKCDALSKVLDTVKNNKVVCLDGAWGSGKTYFCNRFLSDSREVFEFVHIDAFVHDFNSDPLIVLLSEISKVVKEDQKSRYKKNVAKYAAPMMGVGAGVLSRLVPAPGVGVVAEGAAKYLEEKINSYLEVDYSIEEIKKELSRVVEQNHPKKVVVLIDELDRCRPSFSLALIEKIKHVFDVRGIHFVLSMNKEQMLSSIDHAYGIASKKESYLEKFIDFTITLEAPLVQGHDSVSVGAEVDYVRALVDKNFNGLACEEIKGYVRKYCSIIVLKNNIGFRGVDRFVDKCLTSYVSANMKPPEGAESCYACYLCSCVFLSIYRPEWLKMIGNNEVDERFCKSLLVDNFSLNKNELKSSDPYRKDLSEKEVQIGAQDYYGYISAMGRSSAANHAKNKFQNYSKNLTDSVHLSHVFLYWLNHVKSIS